MSSRSAYPISNLLKGVEGELLSLRITVEAYLLEELLEALAECPFPINPEIRHHAELIVDGQHRPAVHVEFPAWRSWIPAIEDHIARQDLREQIQVTSMLEEIRA
ncbi:MAG: hypothetical protein JNK87_39625 [Bryobacterales bacterium]|nr:hypothetical protein [Bryobacterales bacterium]